MYWKTLLIKQNKHHRYGVLGHTLKVIFGAIKDKKYKFIVAGLLHDIGKPTVAFQKPEDIILGEYSFTDHEEVSYQMIKNWKFINNWTKNIVRYHYTIRDIEKCRRKGDKVVFETEIYQLPAPIFRSTNEYTISILSAHKELKEMDRQDKIRATYMHSVLRYLQSNYMTNTSLRERFGIDAKNTAMVSRIIKETLEENKISIYDESVGTRARTYVPSWSK
ncbi:HD domain-containing protein [Thiospirochaeta perfilievii]|uniref:HD domain-containing protein n=1 Tax=Thiospirochaeta perfilievii TaxID=252967 RepID=UPI0016592F4D|nr:HD domain-containing protein [Thiospirochaeta perfilievii]